MSAEGDRIIAAQRAYRERRRGKVQVANKVGSGRSLNFILAMGRRRLAETKARNPTELPK
jgi:hypothetical protein